MAARVQRVKGMRFMEEQGRSDSRTNIKGMNKQAKRRGRLLKLHAEDSNELSNWFELKTVWLSVEIQDEMLEEMAHTILRGIVKEIKERQVA